LPGGTHTLIVYNVFSSEVFVLGDISLLPASWRLTGSAIDEYLDYLSEAVSKGVIDLARGVPDPVLRKMSAVREAYEDVLNDPDITYAYPPLGGPSSLRDLMRRLISELAFEVPPGYTVIITSGSFAAYNSLVKLIITPGN
jgi:DNA-binding transcriptional MocR family regulator